MSDEYDFNGPLPPDVPDGEYHSLLKEVKLNEKGNCFFLEFTTQTAADSENGAGEGKRVTAFFMPKEKGHKFFAMFAREVKDLFSAFKAQPPTLKASEIGNVEAWRPHLEALVSHECSVHVQNVVDKQGKDRTRVSFAQPRSAKKSLPVKDD